MLYLELTLSSTYRHQYELILSVPKLTEEAYVPRANQVITERNPLSPEEESKTRELQAQAMQDCTKKLRLIAVAGQNREDVKAQDDLKLARIKAETST